MSLFLVTQTGGFPTGRGPQAAAEMQGSVIAPKSCCCVLYYRDTD